MVSDEEVTVDVEETESLNPCSNGIWSLTVKAHRLYRCQFRLNPCSNGIWSLTESSMSLNIDWAVLILVLMEYGL